MKTLHIMKTNKLFVLLFSFYLSCTSSAKQEVQNSEDPVVAGGLLRRQASLFGHGIFAKFGDISVLV